MALSELLIELPTSAVSPRALDWTMTIDQARCVLARHPFFDAMARGLEPTHYNISPRFSPRLARPLGILISAATLDKVSQLNHFTEGAGAPEGAAAAATNNPWETMLLEPCDELTAFSRLCSGSKFANTMNSLTEPGDASDPRHGLMDLFVEGLNRTLAYVAMGATLLAEQQPPPAV
jgi:hypothetical protein